MRGRDKIELIKYQVMPGSFSDEGEKIPVGRFVYANEFSTSLISKLQASKEGLRLAGRLEVYTFEYQGEPSLRLEKNGDIYKIVDAQKNGDRTVLTYGEVIGNAN